MVSIAARGDLVVASPNTRVAGATNVTVAVGGLHAHSDLVGVRRRHGRVGAGAGGGAAGVRALGRRGGRRGHGHAISAVEDATGVAALATVP